MTHYETEIGSHSFNKPVILYFANYSDLLDHLQNCFNATADEIEFSYEYKIGLLFSEKNGSIDKHFCDNHNSSLIDLDYNNKLEG
jgi:hypothetical protein